MVYFTATNFLIIFWKELNHLVIITGKFEQSSGTWIWLVDFISNCWFWVEFLWNKVQTGIDFAFVYFLFFGHLGAEICNHNNDMKSPANIHLFVPTWPVEVHYSPFFELCVALYHILREISDSAKCTIMFTNVVSLSCLVLGR